jgi:hypothetical protein
MHGQVKSLGRCGQSAESQLPACLPALQIATPDSIFLLDMLALCGDGEGKGSSLIASSSFGSSLVLNRGTPNELEPADAASISQQEPALQEPPGSLGDGQAPTPQQSTSLQAGAPLSATQGRLSSILARMFADASILKMGFGLSTDLARLAESYPGMPCFGGAGDVPLRCADASVFKFCSLLLTGSRLQTGLVSRGLLPCHHSVGSCLPRNVCLQVAC